MPPTNNSDRLITLEVKFQVVEDEQKTLNSRIDEIMKEQNSLKLEVTKQFARLGGILAISACIGTIIVTAVLRHTIDSILDERLRPASVQK